MTSSIGGSGQRQADRRRKQRHLRLQHGAQYVDQSRHITDFNHINDTFQLENAIFTRLGAGVHALNPAFFRAGAAAADANDYIVYNKATGALFYDDNGNGAGHAVMFAILTNKPVLAANDFQVI